MKAILTIEVPDDFEKGDCDDCIFSRMFDIQGLEDTNCCAYLALVEAKKAVTSLNNIVCTSSNCPLEIQYNTNEFSEREIELMKQGKVISHRPKENSQ